MDSLNKKPFNPFKRDDIKEELKFSFGRMVHRIGSHIHNYTGYEVAPDLINADFEEIGLFYSAYLDSENFLRIQEILNQFPNISEDLKNEIIVVSVLPRYYQEFLKQKIQDKFFILDNKVNDISLKKSSEINTGNKSVIKTPQLKYTDASNRNLTQHFKNFKMSDETQYLSDIFEKQVEKIESTDFPDLNEKLLYYLKLSGKSFQFIYKYLPKQSSFRQLVILHLDFILRTEDIFPNIDPNKKTNAQITHLIIELFQAIGYFEVDTAQDQVRMVNNAFYKKVDLLIFKKLKEKFDI